MARETPSRPPRIGALPRPWKRRASVGGVFGAADLLWLFQAPGNRKAAALSDPLERAAAWGGGRFELWTHGARGAIAMALVDRTDGDALCESMLAWYDAAFDDGSDSELVLMGLTGSGEVVTQNTADEGRPSWSPDGRTIAVREQQGRRLGRLPWPGRPPGRVPRQPHGGIGCRRTQPALVA